MEFWDTVCQELLFQIFVILKSSTDLSRWTTQEDMSVWLSTTMIQALRNLIDLYTFFFETLERFLDGLLDLLCVCICQGFSFYLLRLFHLLTDKQRMTPSLELGLLVSSGEGSQVGAIRRFTNNTIDLYLPSTRHAHG